MSLTPKKSSSSHPKTVVLFDIDGTLLRSGGAARGALEQAMEKVYGVPPQPDVVLDGKTDPQIVRELAAAGRGLSQTDVDARLDSFFDAYLSILRDAISSSPGRIRLFPGVAELIGALESREDVTIGLLTGNIEEGARLKIAAAGLDPSIFRLGSFGSDHSVRSELAAIARKRACSLLGEDIAAERIVVTGDTPHDISCGRAIGARTIGVATGRYTVSDLQAAGAHVALPDLRDTGLILETMTSISTE
jgi:phosphoglycolate phosphatase